DGVRTQPRPGVIAEISMSHTLRDTYTWTTSQALATYQFRSYKLVSSICNTASSCWLSTTYAHEIIHRSSLVVELHTPCTRARHRSVSPGRTSTRQRTCPNPGEPKDPESCSAASTASRIASAQVCQPLAINPPQRPCFARSTSVWNHCGSYWRANVRISASVTTTGPP